MVWPKSLEWACWVTWLLKELTVGMVWPRSLVGILGHMVTKGVNRQNGVAEEAGVGILGHMVIKGVNSVNGVAK
eukprot:2762876-Karenia_brevis.AAC.1